jgi:Ricin-type beta-trefoil lectin domain
MESTISTRFLIVTSLLGLTLTIPAQAQVPDPTVYYKIQSAVSKATEPFCLDVVNGGRYNNSGKLSHCADFTGQYWRFTPTRDGFFRLTTLFRGPDMCLDVFNGGFYDNFVHLTPCANYSGQLWRPARNPARASEPYLRFTTQFRGSGWCLQFDHYGLADLDPCINLDRQYWTLRRTDLHVRLAKSKTKKR